MATRTLLKGGAVLSMDARIGNSLDCDVLIEDDKIIAVSSDLQDAKAEVIDASEMIVAPGFIDTHRHMWKGVLRNTGTARPDAGELGARFRPQDIAASTLSSALGALDAGITTVVDFGDFAGGDEHTAADIDAVVQSGLRAVFAYPQAPSAKSANGHLPQLQELIKGKSTTGLYSLALASSDLDVKAARELAEVWAQARQLGMRICAQVGMGQRAQAESLVAAKEANLLGADVLYAHGNTLTDREMKLIRDTNGSVSISPSAEMTLGYGAPTVQRFLDLNIRPSLGVDSEGAVRGDLFSQMRAVISMQHAMSFEKKLAHKLHPPQITTRDVFEFATIAGARALGMEPSIGSLAPGMQADIILLRQFQINVMPVNDPVGAVVWAMDTSNVDTVFVAGKMLKRAGQLLNVDLPRLRAQTVEAREHVLGAVAA